MRVPFAKYEGLGNDFVLFDAAAVGNEFGPVEAVRVCDRHLGVGADGVLLIGGAREAPSMRVINADGSVPEMCGNGIRCVALHLVQSGRMQSERFVIATDAGPHACAVLSRGEVALVEVEMRAPSLVPRDVPVSAPAPLIDAAIDLGEERLQITAVSIGNPHAVTFADVGERRAALGPELQRREALFPRGVNVGFARMLGVQRIELAVFERGAGWTQACGTGACAAAVAAVVTGRAQRALPIEVDLPGGPLSIVVGQEGERLRMTGPARHVFDGVIEL